MSWGATVSDGDSRSRSRWPAPSLSSARACQRRRAYSPAPARPPAPRRWLPLDAGGKAFGFREPRACPFIVLAQDQLPRDDIRALVDEYLDNRFVDFGDQLEPVRG